MTKNSFWKVGLKMIKGINKQIIEIKCPESEHFEKVLFFVKTENENIPPYMLSREVENYCQKYGVAGKTKSKSMKNFVSKGYVAIISGIILSGFIGLLSVLLIL